MSTSTTTAAQTQVQQPAPAPNAAAPQGSTPALEALQAVAAATGAAAHLSNIDHQQLITLLRHLPDVFNKQIAADQGKEAAAEILSNLAQASVPAQTASNSPSTFPQNGPANANIHPALQGPDPGPNSHPHGPPTLGMTSDPGPNSHPHGPPNLGLTQTTAAAGGSGAPEQTDGSGPSDSASAPPAQGSSVTPEKSSAGRRRAGPPTVNGLTMGSEEWARQRKDNHKEVERRRRGNINEGINELARIVPNGSGEKAKGAVLSRAVQYIHHLKENEARNIEKWTLEKLLMDQAMGDMQAQLDEHRRAWDEERRAKETAEAELAVLRQELAAAKGIVGDAIAGAKRPSPDADADGSAEKEAGEDERGAKRKKIAA